MGHPVYLSSFIGSAIDEQFCARVQVEARLYRDSTFANCLLNFCDFWSLTETKILGKRAKNGENVDFSVFFDPNRENSLILVN